MKKQAFNPYLPSYEYVPDGEPRIFGDRVYVYGSHDLFQGDRFCQGDYVCWSAPVEELGNWRYEGVIYPTNRDPMNAEGKMQLFAPDLVQGYDGRYYLYYSLNGSTVVSVAVCDSPAGDFQFYGYVRRPDGTPYGSREGDVIRQSEHIAAAMAELKTFMFQSVYLNPQAKGEEGKAEDMVCLLFDYYMKHTDKLPSEYQDILAREGAQRAVVDYIAGMTDTYAVEKFGELFIPMRWVVK